jgi:hypothetical protein
MVSLSSTESEGSCAMQVSIPITMRLMLSMRSPASTDGSIGAEGHRFYQYGIPFFSLSRPAAARAAHGK